MKRTWALGLALVLLLTLTACGTGAGQKLSDKSPLPGEGYQVYAVLDTEGEEGPLGSAVLAELNGAVETLGIVYYVCPSQSKDSYGPKVAEVAGGSTQLVVTMGSEMLQALYEGAAQYPNVVFLHVGEPGTPMDNIVYAGTDDLLTVLGQLVQKQ